MRAKYLRRNHTPNGHANGTTKKQKQPAPTIETRADHSREAAQQRKKDFWRNRKMLWLSPAVLSLTLRETRLLNALLLYADEHGRCHPSMATLAAYVIPSYERGDHVPTELYQVRDSLVEKGLLVIEQKARGRRSMRYRVVLPKGVRAPSTLTDAVEVRPADDRRGATRRRRGATRRSVGVRAPSTRRSQEEPLEVPSRSPSARRDESSCSAGNGQAKKKKRSALCSKKQRMKQLAKQHPDLDKKELEELDGYEQQTIEHVLAKGVRSRRLVERVLVEQGVDWLDDLLLLAAQKDSSVNNLGAYLSSLLAEPDKFDRAAVDEWIHDDLDTPCARPDSCEVEPEPAKPKKRRRQRSELLEDDGITCTPGDRWDVF